MIIKKLELRNFQVIENFQAEFNGNVYFITGENELGKSTLLKAIGALLTGERDAVLRNGESSGFAKMVVGGDGQEYEVSLSFTEKNPRGTLTIKNTSTGMASNNVSMLSKIFGYQDFDAVEFSRWSETAEGRRKQIAVVKSLLVPEVRERIESIDAEVGTLKDERTGANRDVKTFDTLLAQITARMEPGDVEKYSSPMDVTVLMQKQQENAALIEKAKTVRAKLAERIEQIAAIPGRIELAEDSLKQAKEAAAKMIADAEKTYQESIAQINSEKADAEQRKANAESWLASYEKVNPENSNTAQLLEQAEAHNKKYSLVEQYKEKKAQFDDAVSKVDSLENKISDLAKERAALIANAELPIEGLSFTDDGLVLNGVPFVPGKVSDSQTMEVAAKLVIAANPTVKVFRIARGESLGAKRLQSIVEIARKNGYQGFIEQVQRGQEEMLVEEYTEE